MIKTNSFWLNSPQTRLSEWRNFRKSNNHKTIEEVLPTIWNIWGNCPQVSMTLDPYDMATWPTVWEMVQAGETCKYSMSLGAAYTIYYLNNFQKISIMRVYDSNFEDIYSTSVIDDKYLLSPKSLNILDWQSNTNNLIIDEVVDIQSVLDAVLYKVV